jgi:hypothetical protein
VVHQRQVSSVARVSGDFFVCSVASRGSLEVCVALQDLGKRIPISRPRTGTSCQPPDTYMDPATAMRFRGQLEAPRGNSSKPVDVCTTSELCELSCFTYFGIVSAIPALARKLLPTFPFGVFMTYSTGIVWNETDRVKRIVNPPPTSHANELFTLPASEAPTLPTPANTPIFLLILKVGSNRSYLPNRGWFPS